MNGREVKRIIDCNQGRCAKDIAVIEHNNVVYTVVYYKPLHAADQKLIVYWNNNNKWGYSYEVAHPFKFDNSDLSQVANHAKVLGDAHAVE